MKNLHEKVVLYNANVNFRRLNTLVDTHIMEVIKEAAFEHRVNSAQMLRFVMKTGCDKLGFK